MVLYHAHSKAGCSKDQWQALKEHLVNVSTKCGVFAEKFGHKNFGEIIGLFHDFGKYSLEFQKRLSGGQRVDHASAGALELRTREHFAPFGEKVLAYCTIGHHSGLPDTGSEADNTSFVGRCKKSLPDYSAYTKDWKNEELELKPEFNLKIEEPQKLAFSIAFLTRMLFSCLIDADWLDTEEFMAAKAVSRGGYVPLSNLAARFDTYIEKFANPKSSINKKRQEILTECIEKSAQSKGFYRLTVPTGGGKTLSSMAFALNHAVKNAQERIIYAIPYTSIIEQNAQVFREIFGDENILEHHSSYIVDNDVDEDSTAEKLKLASQNWDAPIVVTTNVQFFETLFANKPSKCRKLHNIANSVIILDEAQMLPVDYLKPSLRALEELVAHYNCTVVFCSATQPALDGYMDMAPKEIISNPKELETFFKRVEVKNVGRYTDDDLAQELLRHKQVLTIVNTKKHARELFYRLKDEEGTYHLSTSMCPMHRKNKISEIKKRLSEKPELTVRVISTQLLEAGVDIDFPCVYRSSAGLDSIVQSAGRCNRNGKLKMGAVNVFEAKNETLRGYLQRTSVIGGSILKEYEDPICSEAISKYFEGLYKIETTDKKRILEMFTMQKDGREMFNYKSAAKEFNLIEQDTKSIIVPYDETAQRLIEELSCENFSKKALKQLQPYSIQVYDNEHKILYGKGALEVIGSMVQVLRADCYDEQTGLIINKESEGIFI